MRTFLELLRPSIQWKNAASDFTRMDCLSVNKYVVDHADKICGTRPNLFIAAKIAGVGKKLASHPHYYQGDIHRRGIQILEMLIQGSSPPKIALIGFAAYCDAIMDISVRKNPFDNGQKAEKLKVLLDRFDDRFLSQGFCFLGAGRVRAKIVGAMQEMGVTVDPPMTTRMATIKSRPVFSFFRRVLLSFGAPLPSR